MTASASSPSAGRANRLRRARETVRRLEGRPGRADTVPRLSLDGGGPIDRHLPEAGLALGCLHEFVLPDGRDGAGLGLTAWLLGRLVARAGGKPVLWVDDPRSGPLLPQGLGWLGLAADRLVQVRAGPPVDRLWAMEEAARSPALAGVVGAVDRLDLTATRRLQLAAETGGGLCLLLRPARGLTTSTAVTRWQPTAAPSQPVPLPGDGGVEPGLGVPVWDLALMRARGAPPARWRVRPAGDRLIPVTPRPADAPLLPDRPPARILAWPGRRAA